MDSSTVYQFLLFILIVGKKFEFVFCSKCHSGSYLSAGDLPGCVGCPSNCDEQVAADIPRCKKACETKSASTVRPIQTKDTKQDSITLEPVVTTTTQRPKIQSTIIFFRTPSANFAQNNTTQMVESGDSSAENKYFAIYLAVFGTFIVVVVVVVVCVYLRSRTPSVKNARSEEERNIELAGEPSTSSQEPSPMTKRLQSNNGNTKMDCASPVAETETDKLMQPPIPESESDHHVSKLHLQEEEN